VSMLIYILLGPVRLTEITTPLALFLFTSLVPAIPIGSIILLVIMNQSPTCISDTVALGSLWFV